MTGVQTCALPICFPVTIEGAEVTVINEASQNTNAPEINGNDASIDPSESQLLNLAAEIEQTPDANLNDGEYDFGFEEF